MEYAEIILSAASGDDYKTAIEHVTGSTNQFLLELQSRVRSPDPIQVVRELDALISEDGPQEFAMRNGVHYLTHHRKASEQEARALITRIANSLIAARFAVAIRSEGSENSIFWLEKALRAWDSNHDIAVREQPRIFDGVPDVQKLDALFGGIPLLTQPLIELRDLTHYLLSGEPVSAERTVHLRVLRDNVFDQRGVVDHLTLEYLKEGSGFVRDPRSFFLPCDDAFLKVFETVAACAASDFELCGKKGLRWNGGAIRWRLNCPEAPLTSATGGSLGGAVGAGALLLLAGEISEPTLSITATIGEGMRLSGVDELQGSIQRKLHAAMSKNITTILLAAEQAKEWEPFTPSQIKIEGCATALEAAEFIARRSGPRSIVRKEAHGANAKIRLFDGPVDDGMEALYQVCPLMHEVKRVDLPKKMPGRGGDGDDPTAARGPVSITHWFERELNRTEVSYDPVSIDAVFKDKTRFVVVGDPGSGKSTLTQYLAWRATNDEYPLFSRERDLLPAVALREWQNECSTETKKWRGKHLSNFLADQFSQGSGRRPTAEDWQRWLTGGHVLLLADGLDEVDNPEFHELLKDELNRYGSCPMVVTCRTISRDLLDRIGFGEGTCPVYAPSPFDTKQQEAYIRAYETVSKGKFKAEWLLPRWSELRHYHFLAPNPLLLSMICFVTQQLGGKDLPTTRTLLYDEAVNQLLDPKVRKEGTVSAKTAAGSEIKPAEKRRMLEILALRLLMTDTADERRLSFSSDVALGIFQDITEKGYRDYITMAADILSDVTQNTRLFVTTMLESNQSYTFLHRTFHEFLAACALARQADSIAAETPFPENEAGWRRVFDSIDRNRTFTPERQKHPEEWILNDWVLFIDKKAWLSSWQEVYIFLAGKMDDPVPLLDLLSDRFVMRDDVFRHRLALAVHCAAEAKGRYASESSVEES